MTKAFLLAMLLMTLIRCGQDPLAFAIEPIPVGYDRAEVLDADIVDIDNDGDSDLVAATTADLRYLEFSEGRYSDMTAGTALGKVSAVEAVHRDGHDYIVKRGNELSRLEYSGIGTWRESEEAVENFESEPMLEARADFDLDGQSDRAQIINNTLLIEFAHGDTWTDVTSQVAVDGLMLPRPGRRIRAADLEGDGDMDLIVVGGRMFRLINNGGKLAPR